MTPILLQKALQKEMKEITKNILLLTPKGKMETLKIFPQRLPIRNRKEELEPYPYCVVQVISGDIKDTHIITIILRIGIFHDDNNAEGHEELLSIIQSILERFGKNPILDRQYICEKEKKWEIADEDTHPYYYGGILLKFKTAFFDLEGGI